MNAAYNDIKKTTTPHYDDTAYSATPTSSKKSTNTSQITGVMNVKESSNMNNRQPLDPGDTGHMVVYVDNHTRNAKLEGNHQATLARIELVHDPSDVTKTTTLTIAIDQRKGWPLRVCIYDTDHGSSARAVFAIDRNPPTAGMEAYRQADQGY